MLADILSPNNALIFRITHIHNVGWLLANGLHCSHGAQDPNFVAIGNPDLIEKRARRSVPEPPGGSLADYVPFYFTPKSPMLYNIHTGWQGIRQRGNDEIVVIVSSIRTLVTQQVGFVFTDRHAFMRMATFSADPQKLDTLIDWPLIRSAQFSRQEDDPSRMDRYMAEALVYRHLPVPAILGIACATEATRRQLEPLVRGASPATKIVTRPEWYFG